MKLLALDPSSKRTGYAVLNERGAILDAGYLTPDHATDSPIRRIERMAIEAQAIGSEGVDAVVIEITSGHVGKRHKGHGAGLAVYGMAVGAIWGAFRFGRTVRLYEVAENVWTKGRPKATRRNELALRYPKYAQVMAKDGGGDVADAIGLGQWFLEYLRSNPKERA